jgi:hypothetical protein
VGGYQLCRKYNAFISLSSRTKICPEDGGLCCSETVGIIYQMYSVIMYRFVFTFIQASDFLGSTLPIDHIRNLGIGESFFL